MRRSFTAHTKVSCSRFLRKAKALGNLKLTTKRSAGLKHKILTWGCLFHAECRTFPASFTSVLRLRIMVPGDRGSSWRSCPSAACILASNAGAVAAARASTRWPLGVTRSMFASWRMASGSWRVRAGICGRSRELLILGARGLRRTVARPGRRIGYQVGAGLVERLNLRAASASGAGLVAHQTHAANADVEPRERGGTPELRRELPPSSSVMRTSTRRSALPPTYGACRATPTPAGGRCRRRRCSA